MAVIASEARQSSAGLPHHFVPRSDDSSLQMTLATFFNLSTKVPDVATLVDKLKNVAKGI